MHGEIRIVDDDPSARSGGNRTVDRRESARKQIFIDVGPTPAFTVVAVRDVELRARILVRGIGTREGIARGGELVGVKEASPSANACSSTRYAPRLAASAPVASSSVCGCRVYTHTIAEA